MRTAAAILFVVACVAELGGVGLIVREGNDARRALARWERADNPDNDGQGTWLQIALVNEVVRILLGARAGALWGVVLLVLGIAAGTVGNFLTL